MASRWCSTAKLPRSVLDAPCAGLDIRSGGEKPDAAQRSDGWVFRLALPIRAYGSHLKTKRTPKRPFRNYISGFLRDYAAMVWAIVRSRTVANRIPRMSDDGQQSSAPTLRLRVHIS